MDFKKCFLAIAPGSTEMYLIPNYLKEEYIIWCQCEFFDKRWGLLRGFFKHYEIIYKKDASMLHADQGTIQ